MTLNEAMRDADEIGTPREKLLAKEVRRLRGENLDLRAKLHADEYEPQQAILINVREG